MPQGVDSSPEERSSQRVAVKTLPKRPRVALGEMLGFEFLSLEG